MNHWMQAADRIAQAWSTGMLRAVVGGGAALLLAWSICALGKGIPPRIKCWAWRIAYLKLLVALVWVTPIEMPVLRRAAAVPNVMPIVQDDAIPSELITAAPVSLKPPAARPSVTTISRSHLGILALMLGWSVGCGALLLRITFKGAAAAQLLRSCVSIEDERMRQECRRMCEELQIAAPPALRVCDPIHSPLLIGIFKPAIVLPQSMQFLSPAEIRIILAHELAHLKRRDLVWGLFAAVVESLFFFHPLVWLARSESRLAQEMAADRMALQQTAVTPADYGRLLLHVAARACQPPPMLSAAMISSRKTLERRFIAMRNIGTWSRLRMSLVIVALSVAIPAILPHWKLVARAADEPTGGKKDAASKPADQDLKDLNEQLTIKQKPDGTGGVLTPRKHFLAQLNAGQRVKVQPRGDGFLEQFEIKEGDSVKPGQMLFRLDDAYEKAMVAAAQETLAEKKVEYQRKKQMLDKKVIGELEVLEAEMDIKIAETRLSLATAELQNKSVRAPIGGMIEFANPHPQPGEFVSRGTALAVIIAPGDVRAEFGIPQSMRPKLSRGTPVDILVDAYPNEVFQGKVTFISPEINANTGTARVVADVSNPKQLELNGMFGHLSIEELK